MKYENKGCKCEQAENEVRSTNTKRKWVRGKEVTIHTRGKKEMGGEKKKKEKFPPLYANW